MSHEESPLNKNHDHEVHRAILLAAMDGFCMVDMQGRILEVNAAFCRMTGYSEAELLTMSIANLEVIETAEMIAARLVRMKEFGGDLFETRHRRKDGTIIDLEVSAQYQPFGGGRVIAFLRDITEQLRAAEALRARESFIKTVMDNLPIGIAVNSVDPSVSFHYMNDNFPAFYRTSRAALTCTDTFWEAVYEDPSFRAAMKKRVLDDCASGDPARMHWVDVPITRKGERTTYIEARNTPVAEMKLMISTVWDVTGRKEVELALQQEQSLYADLVTTLPAGAYRLRVKDKGEWQGKTWRAMAERFYSLDFASDRFCSILGISHDALAADPGVVSDVIHPEERENFDARNAQAMTDFNPFVWEGRILHQEQTRWVHFESVPRCIDAETVLWTGIVYDISELKQSLKEREQFFRFFQTSADLMCLADPHDCFLKTNRAFTKTLGYSEAELLARPYIEFIHPDDQQTTLDELDVQQQRGYTDNFENRYLCKDGSVKWLSWRVSFDKDDGIAYATARDVTAKREAETALREGQEQLRVIFDASQSGIILVSPQGEILFANSRMAELFGMPLEKLIGSSYAEHIHPSEAKAGDERMQQLIRGEIQSVTNERHYRRADGTDFWGFLSGKRLENPDGSLRALVGIIADLTEQKRLQEQLSQAQKMESVGRLAGGVAHDFNNTLSVIIGHAQLARMKESLSPRMVEHFEQIEEAAERSSYIARQLLAFARKQTATPRILDLNQTVADMLKILTRLIGENIDLVWIPAESVWPVKLDPAQIDQILANLCINARDAIVGNGRISIETRNQMIDAPFAARHTGLVAGDYVLLTVSDDGCGMEKETIRNIFEPFFTTKEVGKGTGLGLATVYGIVKQNDGFIDVYSEARQGTSFKIYLPRYREGEEESPASERVEPVKRGQETILLVEDESAILALGKELLETQGYSVLTAATPGEAIHLATEHRGEIHLLLTDVIMPEMNGRELAGKLLSFYPGLKRLFMSGYTADIIAHHGVLDEGVHFIQKPFSFATLATKVREALDS